MATPEKTSETLNLAEALNQDTSSDSGQLASGSSANKPKDDDENANMFSSGRLERMSQRLNDIDISFRQKVVTKESSLDFIVHEDLNENLPSPLRESFSPENSESEPDLIFTEGGSNNDPLVKSDNDKDWKSQSGNVYDQVFKIQSSEPKKYTPNAFIKKEEEITELKPEIVSCPKCGRKIAQGAFNRHVQFCNA